jgi:phosphate:Na+ symporter
MQISKTVDKKTDAKLWFDQNQRDNLNMLFDKVLEAYELMISNLSGNYSEINLDKSISLEVSINELRNDIRKKHFKSMEKGDYNAQSGLIYSNIFSSIERVGDHIINVSEAASGQYLN